MAGRTTIGIPPVLGDVLDGAGTDISHRLSVPHPCPGMLRLLQRRDLIVAKLESLVDVYPDELAAADGSEILAPSRADDLGAPAQGPSPDHQPVWISCAGEVYDMTCKYTDTQPTLLNVFSRSRSLTRHSCVEIRL